MKPVQFRSDVSVQLVKHSASDADVPWAARVSTAGERSLDELSKDPSSSKGLISYLMKNKHGCYDEQTEVLTEEGWKYWPDIRGDEKFLTLNLMTDEMTYQSASRIITKYISGPMISVTGNAVDLMVTPDHNMVARPRAHRHKPYGLYKAEDFLKRCHRLRMDGGTWTGNLHCPQEAAMIGFIAADGNVKTSIDFHLRKTRKINWLKSHHTLTGKDDHFRLSKPSKLIRNWAKQTYNAQGERCFPRELMSLGDRETLSALLQGYLMGDGSVTELGRITCSTASRQLVNDIQEVAVKIGRVAVEIKPSMDRAESFGTKTLYRVTIYNERNTRPRIGLTIADRERQVNIVPYEGNIYCASVPNGTLYVRRSGKPVWSGNSPFEHNSMTFFVHAPIFVFREFHRHRIGFSYNEESGRYKVLDPMFYVPDSDRPLVQQGKAGHYVFVAGTSDQHRIVNESTLHAYEVAYSEYRRMLDAGIAREVARVVLPVGLFSSMYATCNARSLMHFLSLRTNSTLATNPSFPMREIEMVAEKMEDLWRGLMPITHAAFNAHGRVAP